MARVLNDCTALKGVLSAVLLRLVYDGLTIIVVLSIMVRMNPILGLLSFAASPAAILFGRWIRPKIEQASRAVRDRAGDITGNLQSWLVDSLALKAFRVQHTAEAQFAEHNYRLRDAGVRAGILGSCASFANFFLVGIPSLLIFGYGGGQVLKGGLTVGELFAFMTYSTYFNAPLQRLVSLALVAVPAQIALLHRIQEVTGSTQGSSPLLLAAPRALSLKIRDLRVELSSGFTLTVPSFDGHAGEIVGVTGPNGSGKSTLIRTILGVQPADSGSLEFESADGQRVEEAIRRGFVPQKAILFPGTVLDNVTLFDAKPDIERATDCLKRVGLSAWLTSLPGRIEEKSLGNGKMSGGQLQRLNLARVLYSRAGITLLDEPGNSLDDQVETELIPILRSIAARGTVIVTTHSPAVLAHCDRVYRMTHAERGQNAASCSISHDFAQIGVH
jgi:ABC-type bacteriocin/lantibiotic exporter with double-glycine peptidase domain